MAETEPFEVVISGIAGQFPESNNIEELKSNLFGKVDMITVDDRRWPRGQLGVPEGSGRISNEQKFDANFFAIHRKLCRSVDPLVRLFLERTFEAIIDSGCNPKSMHGANIGVFTASTTNEIDSIPSNLHNKEVFGILAGANCMLANRISFFYDFKGPSVHKHTSFAGGMELLSHAAEQIATGHIQAAVIGVTGIQNFPNHALEYKHLHLLSADGKCRSFDDEATGYARSEGVVAFFLQRKIEAKRNYGTVVHVKTETIGSRDCGYLDTDEKSLTGVFKEFYKECKVDPSSIAYLEADGSANKRIETIELNSLSKVLCEGRQSPLLIGSVKSNLGHTEVCSALVSVVKTVIAMETGLIPPNLHYNVPNSQVAALNDGKLKVVCNPKNLPGNLVAVNSMSINGVVGHILLRRNSKVKRKKLQYGELPEDGLPRLILASARHDEGIKKISNFVKDMPLDVEFAALMNNIHKYNIAGHMYRMFQLLPSAKEVVAEIQECDSGKLEVWFIFSGMGSQWNGMGTGLLKIPVFAAAIDKCDKILAPLGIDIKYILTSMDPLVFANVVNCFVGIAAVQIGLTDVLKSLNIVADGFVGHSAGELGCAYADGNFTAEEMILSAYYRGRASLEAGCIRGMMAAVGLGYNNIKNRLPEGIQVACHNSEDSCTLSGPADDMETFVNQLKSEKIFARTVNVANIAYHSRYVKPIEPILLRYLKEVIKDPKPRTSKWISTSVPEAEWNTPLAQSCSAEYFTNNLVSSVFFEEACKHIPANAIAIEIAPHGLLQAILRRSLPNLNLSLTSRTCECSVRYLLQTVGRLYINGLLPDVNALYPPVEYPVSRGTPGIGHLVSWEHYEDWELGLEHPDRTVPTWEEITIKNIHSHELGHMINNEVVLPVSALLIYIWKKFSVLQHEKQGNISRSLQSENVLSSVAFEDVTISRHIVVPNFGNVHFNLMVQRSGKFEIITAEREFVMCGRISELETKPEFTFNKQDQGHVVVSHSDFYSVFESKGYVLDSYYKAVKELHLTEKECSGEILWNNDWLPFLESMFKVNIFLGLKESEGNFEPTFIQRLLIDTSKFLSLANGSSVPFKKNNIWNMIQCNGLELFGVMLAKRTSPLPSQLKVEKYQFVPHIASGYEMSQFLSIVVQVVAETNFLSWNSIKTNIVIYEISDDTTESLAEQFRSVIQNQLNIEAQVQTVLIEELKSLYLQAPNRLHLIVSRSNLLCDCVQQFDNKDIVYFLTYYPGRLILSNNSIVPVLQYKFPLKHFTLLKKSSNVTKWNTVDNIDVSDWLLQLRSKLLQIQNDEPIVVCWNYSSELCVAEICKVLAKEKSYAHRLKCFFILDKNAPTFDKTNPYYLRQLQQGLPVNVLSGGVWGSFRRLDMEVIPENFEQQVDVSSITLGGLEVKYFGLNPYNLSVNVDADDEFELGHLEYSGLNESGEEVMGLAQYQKSQNEIKPDNTFSWAVPKDWSLEDAATVPLAFTTVYYSLVLKANLKSGQTVLITAGYSPLGEAAIAVAMHMGGDVFTTVSNDQQAAALIKRFPKLKPNQILNESTFEFDLMRQTKAKGVQVIVNCLDGPYLERAMQCAVFMNQFIQFGQTSMKKKAKLGLNFFMRCKAFFSVATDNIFNAKHDWKTQMKSMIQEGIQNGVVKPFKMRAFPKTQSKEALEFLKKDRLEMKVILMMKHEQSSQTNNNRIQFNCDPNKSYLIVGTKNGFWLDFAEWLVRRGARKIIFAYEEKSVGKFDLIKLQYLISHYSSTIMLTSATCIETENNTIKLLKETIALGPLAAIFNIMLDNNSNKVKNLDSASRLLVPELPYFVCLFGGSSEVCDARRQSGLPGLVIQWDMPLQKPAEVFRYLKKLLDDQDTNPGSQLILVNSTDSYKKLEDLCRGVEFLQEYLPSKSDLFDIGASISEKVCLEEITTLSLRREYLKSFNAIFLFPGFKHSHLQSLIAKLLYPVFCVKLPSTLQTIQETASTLVSEILAVKNNGPYTLVSETWCGALAVEVGCQLEVQGHTVGLILLESAPTVIQHWARIIGEPATQKFDNTLLSFLLNTSSETNKEISQTVSWPEKLKCALKSEDEKKRETMGLGLTWFRRKLKALLNYKPSPHLFQGQVDLLVQKNPSDFPLCDLFQHFGKVGNIHLIKNVSTHTKLIASNETAKIINDNTTYNW